MTTAERKRLAEEARKLAMECLEGTAPFLNEGNWCGCAIGTILGRSGVPVPHSVSAPWKDTMAFVRQAEEIDRLLPDSGGDEGGLVSNALIEADLHYLDRNDAVVFPLLALADALEDAALAAKENP